MSIHIDKTSYILREQLGVDKPVIAAAYLKFAPVPDEWKDLPSYFPDKEIDVHPKLKKLAAYSEATATILSIKNDGEVSSKIVAKEECLEIFIFLAGYLMDMFKPEIKERLKKLYKKEGVTADDVSELVREIMLVIIRTNKILKNTARELYSDALVILGDANLAPRMPEAQLGVLANLEKFQDSFSRAKHKALDLDDRCRTLKRALKQLKFIQRNLIEKQDKQFVHIYLYLRTRDKNLFVDAVAGSKEDRDDYNKVMQEICDIRDSLGEESDSF